ncbi:MAG: SH3 domain-containing protein [Selenomonas sp.]|nr:SH3 domain-containing protein [Selenomonas sp.]
MAQIPLGQAVGFIEDGGNGFYKINFDGQVGYALVTYLSRERPVVQNQPNGIRQAKIVNCKEFVSLRSTPSTESERLAPIFLGDYVDCYGDAGNGFYEIGAHGPRGYRRSYELKEYIVIL